MTIHLLQLPYFLSDDDIATVKIVTIKAFGDSLKRPYPSGTLQCIKDFRNALVIPYSKINDYDIVTMLQEKITREYVVGSRGMSYRICKGVTYRIGSFKGRPVERCQMEKVGIGSLVVTNKHFFFHCPTASVKIPYSKLIGVTPYSDGLEVHKEEAKPKRTVFQGFDAWFVMNALNALTHN